MTADHEKLLTLWTHRKTGRKAWVSPFREGDNGHIYYKYEKIEGGVTPLRTHMKRERFMKEFAPVGKTADQWTAAVGEPLPGEFDLTALVEDLRRKGEASELEDPWTELVDTFIDRNTTAGQQVMILNALGDIDLSEPELDLRKGWDRVRQQLAFNALYAAVTTGVKSLRGVEDDNGDQEDQEDPDTEIGGSD